MKRVFPAPKIFSWHRVYAMVLRHTYLLRGSWTRLAEMAYWPIINVLMWGFTSRFLTEHSDWLSRATGILLASVMLWDLLFRCNLGMSMSFLEEMWSRNLGHLAVSPLTAIEWMISMIIMSLIRTMIGVVPSVLLAIPLYHFSIFDLGTNLLAFMGNLMITGWAFGLGISALVLRYGQGAESLAWVAVVAIAPFCGIYYPVSTLPEAVQWIAYSIPATYVFEAMRAVMFGAPLPVNDMLWAAFLNLLYMGGAIAIFLRIYHVARVRGLFLSTGE